MRAYDPSCAKATAKRERSLRSASVADAAAVERWRRGPLTGAAQLRQLSSISAIDHAALLCFLICRCCCSPLLLLCTAVSLLLNGVQLIEGARRVGVHGGGRRTGGRAEGDEWAGCECGAEEAGGLRGRGGQWNAMRWEWSGDEVAAERLVRWIPLSLNR